VCVNASESNYCVNAYSGRCPITYVSCIHVCVLMSVCVLHTQHLYICNE